MAETLQEAEVEPLYRILLKDQRTRPPTYPEQVHHVRHSRYCAYHQYVGHPISKYRALKEHLEELIQQGIVK